MRQHESAWRLIYWGVAVIGPIGLALLVIGGINAGATAREMVRLGVDMNRYRRNASGERIAMLAAAAISAFALTFVAVWLTRLLGPF